MNKGLTTEKAKQRTILQTLHQIEVQVYLRIFRDSKNATGKCKVDSKYKEEYQSGISI